MIPTILPFICSTEPPLCRSRHHPSFSPRSLIEVPLYAPGVQHAMFLLVARNSTLQDVTQAARSFVSTHPVFGFDSSPADSVERKMAYVVAMTDLVCVCVCVCASGCP